MTTNEHAMGRTVVSNGWAKDPLGEDPYGTLQLFQRDLKVGLIATDRSALKTCGGDEELAAVVERYRSRGFDFLPVTEQESIEVDTRNRIIGLIEIAPFMQGMPIKGSVRTNMRHLSEENLIGADASILSFIRNADRQKSRLIISDQDISGLVSLSDLHRLPVRAALFGLVTYLEILMADAIRREFGGTEGWLERLSEDRRRILKNEIDKSHKDDSFVDALLFTQFGDKVHRTRLAIERPKLARV